MKYRIRKDLVFETIKLKTAIFDSQKSVLYTLNETASYIFNKIRLGWDQEKIIKGLEKNYAVEKTKANKDFESLISELKKKNIIF